MVIGNYEFEMCTIMDCVEMNKAIMNYKAMNPNARLSWENVEFVHLVNQFQNGGYSLKVENGGFDEIDVVLKCDNQNYARLTYGMNDGILACLDSDVTPACPTELVL